MKKGYLVKVGDEIRMQKNKYNATVIIMSVTSTNNYLVVKTTNEVFLYIWKLCKWVVSYSPVKIDTAWLGKKKIYEKSMQPNSGLYNKI